MPLVAWQDVGAIALSAWTACLRQDLRHRVILTKVMNPSKGLSTLRGACRECSLTIDSARCGSQCDEGDVNSPSQASRYRTEGTCHHFDRNYQHREGTDNHTAMKAEKRPSREGSARRGVQSSRPRCLDDCITQKGNSVLQRSQIRYVLLHLDSTEYICDNQS